MARYDYSLLRLDYSDRIPKANDKIRIICSKHGVFKSTYNNHLKGSGCPKCNGGKQLSTIDFIEKAIERHGDKYDYSNTIYRNSRSKLEILCKDHGIFITNANNHLNGKGCPICNGGRKLSTEEFTIKAIIKHGNQYDYSKVKYKKSNQEVIIVCKTHGQFSQPPNRHLNGGGCPQCGRINIGNNNRKKLKTFIYESQKKHNNTYDYSLVNYINQLTNIEIICKKHGSFFQTPHSHLSGSGCQKCGKIINIKIKTKNLSFFISKAKKIHGNRYDYSKSIYISAKTPITIICKKHGEFKQAPTNHYAGKGCSTCAGKILKR